MIAHCLVGVVQGLSHASDAQLTGVKQPATLLWGDVDRSHQDPARNRCLAVTGCRCDDRGRQRIYKVVRCPMSGARRPSLEGT
jgi:hypothetical protein